jgi:POT family proton-dependent oligopeptide transporter
MRAPEEEEKAALQPGPAAGDDKARDHRVLLHIVLVLRFVESFSYFTLNNVFTLHLTDVLGISDAAAGTLFGLRGAVQMFYGIALGPIVDTVGVTRSLWVAFGICALGRGSFALATTREVAMLSVYGPMAIGHALVGTVLSIAIKRATHSDDDPTAASWGFAMSYCATVLGIMLCGPFIDAMTIIQHPVLPYAQLALITSALSIGMMVLSIAAFDWFPGAGVASSLPRTSSLKASARSHDASGSKSCAGVAVWVRSLRSTVCTRRFARFCAFSVAILPGSSVLRNLDGGIYPKFMLRTFGPTVPKGTIYALEPALDLILVPLFTKLTAARSHFVVIRVGLCIAAISPLVIYMLGATIPTVVGFVLVLTLGDALYTARTGAKRHFSRHLCIKCIILPRQARDKHRESTQTKEWRFA